MGFEPTTSSLGSWHSTTELRPPLVGLLLLSTLKLQGPQSRKRTEPDHDSVRILSSYSHRPCSELQANFENHVLHWESEQRRVTVGLV